MSDRFEGGGAEPPAGAERLAFLEAFAARLVDALGSTLGEEGARAFVETAASAWDAGRNASEGRDLAEALAAAMNRHGGAFSVESAVRDEIVLVNGRCPFGAGAVGRRSLCTLTETRLGEVAAASRGYTSVEVAEAFATGHGRCLLRVHLAGKRPGRAFRR